jgi:hypothetical protein
MNALPLLWNYIVHVNMEGVNSYGTLVIIKMRFHLGVCFSPEGYNLPLEYTKLAAQFSQGKKHKNAVWICKPIGQSQGRGIFLFKVSPIITVC